MSTKRRLSLAVLLVAVAGAWRCSNTSDPTPVPRPTATPTPAPTSTPAPTPTATPAATATRDPRGSRCELCGDDSECRPPLRCFPFTDGRNRCDNENPGPPC